MTRKQGSANARVRGSLAAANIPVKDDGCLRGGSAGRVVISTARSAAEQAESVTKPKRQERKCSNRPPAPEPTIGDTLPAIQ